MRTVQRANYIYNSVGIVELCEILFFFLVLSAMKLSQNRYVCFEGRFLNYSVCLHVVMKEKWENFEIREWKYRSNKRREKWRSYWNLEN